MKIVERHDLKSKAPKINWGPDFQNMPVDKKLRYMLKFCDSFNHALDIKHQEYLKSAEAGLKQEKQIMALENNLNGLRNVWNTEVANHNTASQEFQKTIANLQTMVRSEREKLKVLRSRWYVRLADWVMRRRK